MRQAVAPVRRWTSGRDSGFTLIELLVTLSIVGIMSALAIGSFASWSASSQQRAARDEVVSTLRNAAERALSEGRTYCVHYQGSTWTTYRSACTTAAGGTRVAGPTRLDSSRATLTTAITPPAGLQGACPTAGTCAYFYPRGNASPGTVQVATPGRSNYVVTIVGLTSRVYAS